MSTVGTELQNEIERVGKKLERWRRYQSDVTDAAMKAGLAPGIALMNGYIEAAKIALAKSDTVACISLLNSLRDYDDED